MNAEVSNIFQSCSRFFIKKGLPLYIIVFLTQKCNANCEYCFRNKRFTDMCPDLSLDELEKISKTIGVPIYLIFTGGEIFIRDDVSEIVSIFYKNSKTRIIDICTNGFYTEKIILSIEQILKNNPDLNLGVSMSIDGDKNTHDSIRRLPGSYDRVIETYLHITELKKKYNKLNVNMAVTISALNQEKISETYNFLANELKVQNIRGLLVRGEPKNPAAIQELNIEKYTEFHKLIHRDFQSGKIKGFSGYFLTDFLNAKDILSSKIISEIFRTQNFQTPCYAGHLTGVIFNNGDVYPCELLDKKIGSLRESNYDFKKIWLSKNAKNICDHIKKNKCFCTHELFLANNILFNIRYMPKLLLEILHLKYCRIKNILNNEKK